MKRYVFFALLSLVLSGCAGVTYSEEVNLALERLDGVIENKEMIEKNKENDIRKLRSSIGGATSDRELYDIYDDLMAEYFQYNVDSVITYAYKKINLAKKIGDPELITDAVLDLAQRHTLSGLYESALYLLDEYEGLDGVQYISILNTVNSNLASSSHDPVMAERYRTLKKGYQKEMLSKLGEDDITRLFIQTDILLDDNRQKEVLDLLLPWLDKNEPSLEDQGIIYYTIARAYDMMGDSENAILWYARSAESDLLVPKYEYRSLYELAGKLYERNDTERAYSYITRSVEDALQSNAQLHKQFSYQILPVISNSYNDLVEYKNRMVQLGLLISVVLLILLFVMLVELIKERNLVVVTEKETKKRNIQLQELTEELKRNVEALRETNMVKDMYLGRYLSMCSDYIDGLEKYRKSLRKVVKEGEDVNNALKSKQFMEEALEDFYGQFDATFLDLFPDFLSKVNELLQEDKQVSYHSKERLLTTELRVLALIRLGVDDSVKIANFLRRSVSTIYNYRVKMRNSSICEREDFEKRLMDIGMK